MEVPSRHRPLLLLAAVIVAQVLLLAFQIRRSGDVPLIRIWSAEMLTPLQRVGSAAFAKIEGVWFGYVDLHNARKENRKLTQEVGALQLENQQLKGQASEALRLAKLLGFRRENAEVPMIAAEVIGANADSNSQTLFINRGADEGIRRNMAVITPDGVVGRIFEAFSHTAQVLLITDRESGLGALLAGSRTHGVVNGTGGPFLSLDYVSAEEKIPADAEVLTSGEDRIFPKNLPVGAVASMKPGAPFQKIQLRPAAHLDRLEEVLVVLSGPSSKLRENDTNTSQQKSPVSKEEKNALATSALKSGAPAKAAQQPAGKPAAGDKKEAPQVVKKTAPNLPGGTPQ